MKVAIHQPNFLPWLGYFNKIKQVDFFVFLDDVQFERGKTFTSRTKIIANNQEHWLTIPIKNKSDLNKINKTEVDISQNWKYKHLKTLEMNYKKTLYFNEIFKIIERVYEQEDSLIVNYNIPLIIEISSYLNFNTQFIRSSNIESSKDKQGLDKLLCILKEMQATTYISGSGAGSKRYVKEDEFQACGIDLEWQLYEHPTYPQLSVGGDFIPNLSIVDALFNCGREGTKKLI